MSPPPSKAILRTHSSHVPPPPVDPAPWLERTEALVDRYRKQLSAAGAAAADPGLGYIWIAADHVFEAQGRAADFSLLDVALLMEDCAWLTAGKAAQLVTAVSAFYRFLGAERLIDPGRAAVIQAELARYLPKR
jgi:hypothetical protein